MTFTPDSLPVRGGSQSTQLVPFQLPRKEDKLGPHTQGLGHLAYSVL